MNRKGLAMALAGFALGLLLYTTTRTHGKYPPIREGYAPPALKLMDVAGQRHSLTQYKGRVVLVDFWATWCDTCVDELPELKRLYARYRAKGFEILAPSLDIDARKVLLPFIAQHSIPWRVLLADSDTTRAYRVFGLPAKFLIDPEGVLARRYDGPTDPRVLETDIRRLLRIPAQGDT